MLDGNLSKPASGPAGRPERQSPRSRQCPSPSAAGVHSVELRSGHWYPGYAPRARTPRHRVKLRVLGEADGNARFGAGPPLQGLWHLIGKMRTPPCAAAVGLASRCVT
jgi:hypothetical protein